MDFKETFSPVVKFDSIKIVFSIIVVEDMNITQFDICIIFLYGEIKEEIYMTQPLGFENIKEAKLNGGLVAWGSCKQDCITKSTTEAKYFAAHVITNEIT